MSEVFPRHLSPDGRNRSPRGHRSGAIAFGVVLTLVVLGVAWFTVALLDAVSSPPPPAANSSGLGQVTPSPGSDDSDPGGVPPGDGSTSSSASSTTADPGVAVSIKTQITR